MLQALIRSAGQSVIQDIATSAAAYFAAQGWLHGADQQAVIGSIFCLGMLALNAFLQHKQTK